MSSDFLIRRRIFKLHKTYRCGYDDAQDLFQIQIFGASSIIQAQSCMMYTDSSQGKLGKNFVVELVIDSIFFQMVLLIGKHMIYETILLGLRPRQGAFRRHGHVILFRKQLSSLNAAFHCKVSIAPISDTFHSPFLVGQKMRIGLSTECS